jgi:hypothetical protein
MMKFNQKHKGINENDFSMKKDIWTCFWIYVMHNCKSIKLQKYCMMNWHMCIVVGVEPYFP